MPTKGTPKRGIRIDDELWNAALASAARRGDNLADILRDRLREYISEEETNDQD